MKKTKALAKMSDVSLATELHAIQDSKKTLEKREKEIKAELLAILKKQGVQSIKLESGIMYVRSFKPILKVTKGQEEQAFTWAKDNFALKVDTAVALDILRRQLAPLPAFFTKAETEYLVVKGMQTEEV